MAWRLVHDQGSRRGDRRVAVDLGGRHSTGEEPQPHVHEEDELFYVLSGTVTFHCNGQSFEGKADGFMFLPRAIPHSYTIDSEEARLLGFSVPSGFGDHIEKTGKPVKRKPRHKRGKGSNIA